MASTPDPWLFFCLLVADATSPAHVSTIKQRFAELRLVTDQAIGSGEKVRSNFACSTPSRGAHHLDDPRREEGSCIYA
jgi:hypothetical protein